MAGRCLLLLCFLRSEEVMAVGEVELVVYNGGGNARAGSGDNTCHEH